MRLWAHIPLLVALLSSPGKVASASPLLEVKAWPETFYQWAIRRPENLDSRFTGALFDGENHSDLFVDNFTGGTSLNFSTSREVFNNYDLIGSWTVVDRVRFRLNSTLIGYGTNRVNAAPEGPGFSFPFFGVNFGVQGTLEWRNYRQLSPTEVRSLPAPMMDPDTAHATPADPDISEINPYLSALNLNPNLGARLKKFLNPFTLPFRMPLSRSDLRHMRKGEVIAYNLSGRVGFRGTFGWQVIPATDLYFGANTAIETHLDGEYLVAVMKEDDRYAKVRVSRIRGHGSSLRVNTGLDWRNVFQGIFLFKETSFQLQLGNLSTRVIPFYFELSRFHQKEIDIAYRYDLETPEGREAFHRAVLGSLVPSEDAAQADEHHPNPSVVRLYDRATDHLNWTRSTGSTLSLFLNRRQDRSEDSIETEVHLPEGTRHLYRTSSQKSTLHNALFGSTEKTSRRISLLMDQEGFRSGMSGSILIIAENSIEDSSTSPRELNDYTREVGTFFGRSSWLPDFPDEAPPEYGHSGNRRSRRAWYGRSSFYYGFSIDQESLSRWLNQDSAALLEHARKNRLELDAETFTALKSAFESRDSIQLHSILQRLLSNRNQTEALMNLFKLHLPQDSLENFLVAQNPAFGNIQQRGHTLTELESVFRNTDPELGAGSPWYKSAQDPNARVNALECESLTDRKIRVRFDLSHDPGFVFLSLTPLTGRGHRQAVELVVFNRNRRFHEGQNEWILDPASEDPVIHRLTSEWNEREGPMSLTLGFSREKNQWGYGSSCQFRLDPSGISKKKLKD